MKHHETFQPMCQIFHVRWMSKVKLDFQLHDPTQDEDFISACEENYVNEVEPKTCSRTVFDFASFHKAPAVYFSLQIEVMY